MHVVRRFAWLLPLLVACEFDLSRDLQPGEIRGALTTASGLARLDAVVLRLLPGGRATTTDADGTFAFRNLSAGTYLLRAELDLDGDGVVDGGVMLRRIELHLEDGSVSGLELGALEAGRFGRVRGTLSAASGAVSDVLVALSPEQATFGSERLARTDAEGRFEIDDVLAGDYTLRALRFSPGNSAVAELRVEPDGIATAALALVEAIPATATLAGTLHPTQATAERFEVVVASNSAEARTEAQPDVPFELEVPPGIYTLVARSPTGAFSPVVIPELLVQADFTLTTIAMQPAPGADVRDLDADGVAASADPDDDGDGHVDADEPPATRLDPTSWADLDADTFGDGIDPDDDGDGLLDVLDACPLRRDPPALTLRPAACAPYPGLTVALEAPAEAVVSEPFAFDVTIGGGLGEPELTLALTGPDGAEATPVRNGLEFRAIVDVAGAWTLRATATDPLHTVSAERVIVVGSPPLLVDVTLPGQVIVDEPVGARATLAVPLSDVTWQWSEEETSALTITNAGTDEPVIGATQPGDYTVRVSATRGGRSGSTTVVVHVVAPELPLSVPATLELTAGTTTTIAARLTVPLTGVSFRWTESSGTGAGLTLADAATTLLTVGSVTPGTWQLRCVATRGARTAERLVTVTVHPVGVIGLVELDARQLVGEQRTWLLSLPAALDGAEVVVAPKPGNPSGSVIAAFGAALVFTAANPGAHRFDVEARVGARLARGTVSIFAELQPTEILFGVLPRPFPMVDKVVTITATASTALGSSAAWSWTQRGDNPEQVTLAGADTGTITFTPTTPGLFRFDAQLDSQGSLSQRSVEVKVFPPPEIPVSVAWYDNRVGREITFEARTSESLTSGATWTWSQDPANPEQLTFRTSGANAYATPTLPGTYRVTVNVADGLKRGTRVVDVEVVPDSDDQIAISLRASPTVGSPDNFLYIYPVSRDTSGATAITWMQDPSNPELFDLSQQTSYYLEILPVIPGRYVFSVQAREGAATGFATVAVDVLPAIPIEITHTHPLLSLPVTLTASTPDTSGPVTWSWQVVARPPGASTSTRVSPNNAAVGTLSMGSIPGRWTVEVTARIGARIAKLRHDIDVVDLPPPQAVTEVSGWVHRGYNRHRGAVGVPMEIRAYVDGGLDPTFAWSSISGPAPVTIEDATSDVWRFTPTVAGTYVFRLSFGAVNMAQSKTFDVTVLPTMPDVYIDGLPGIPLFPLDMPRTWVCRSGRTDVASATWERIAPPHEGTYEIDGAFLRLKPTSLRQPLSAFRCTITTTGGETFTAKQAAVVVNHDFPHRVHFQQPETGPIPDCGLTPKPAGCAGTWEDPYTGFDMGLEYGCFFFCDHTPRTIVMFAGDYVTGIIHDATATMLLGGVDRETLVQNPKLYRTRVTWYGVNPPAPLMTVNRGSGDNPAIVDGIHWRVFGAAGATKPVVVVESSGIAAFTRNIIEVEVGPQQSVVAYDKNATSGSTRSIFAGNRVRITGGNGPAAVRETCRGTLLAHNAIEVDATSTVATGVLLDCGTGSYQRYPMQVVNNAVFMRNGGVGFAVDGVEATHTAHRFAGNWFAGTGLFVTAPRHEGGALALATAEAVNAGRAAGGLDGGGNTLDPACFAATAPTDPWLVSVLPGSPCVDAARAPNPSGAHDVHTHVALDTDQTVRDLPAGWGASVDIGPEEL